MVLPSWILVSVGGRRSLCRGPSPILGPLGYFHQQHHKSRLSLWDPLVPMVLQALLMERCMTPIASVHLNQYPNLLQNLKPMQSYAHIPPCTHQMHVCSCPHAPPPSLHLPWLSTTIPTFCTHSSSTFPHLLPFFLVRCFTSLYFGACDLYNLLNVSLNWRWAAKSSRKRCGDGLLMPHCVSCIDVFLVSKAILTINVAIYQPV